MPSDSALIDIRDMEKVYDMGPTQVHALNGVSLAIAANEYVTIMGPSGSGKSTLMNIVGCLDVASSGTYELNRHLVSDMDDDELARVRNMEIGFIFQAFNLLARSNALRNVELPLIYAGIPTSERSQLAERALDSVGLADRMHHLPNELSGGQRQRVAIARALVNSPSIILADEPTGALDTRTGEEIMDLFDSLHANGNTIIVVTHEEHIAACSERVIYLRDGVIERDERQTSSRVNAIAAQEPAESP